VSHTVEKAAVHLTLVGAIGIAEQRQRTGFGNDRLPAADDLVERRLPSHRRKPAFALGAHAAQRCRKPLWRVHELMIAVHLGAGKAGRQRVGAVTLDADDAPILDVGEHRAHVRTIVRTYDADGLHLVLLRIAGPWRRTMRQGNCGRKGNRKEDEALSGHRPGSAQKWPSVCFLMQVVERTRS
jgi:hypothetical protein